MFCQRRFAYATDAADLDDRHAAPAQLGDQMVDLGMPANKFTWRGQVGGVGSRAGFCQTGYRLKLLSFAIALIQQIAKQSLDRRTLQFVLNMAGRQPNDLCDFVPRKIITVAQLQNLGVKLRTCNSARCGLLLRCCRRFLELFDPLTQQRRQLVAIDPRQRRLSVLCDALSNVDTLVDQL